MRLETLPIKDNVDNKQGWELVLNDKRLGRKVHYHDYKDREHLTIVPMGDEHDGSKFYDSEFHKEIKDWCLENSCPIVGMGDHMETATKTSVGAGIFEQSEIVQQQLESRVEFYKELADEGLDLGHHIGNHEMRIYNSSGANLAKVLCMMLKVPYLDVGAAHIFRVGKQIYTMYTTHGNSGARLPHTKIANVIKLQCMIDSEIYAQGHLHQLSHHVQNYYEINKRKRTIEEAQKHYILTGSYLDHWGSYAHTANMEPARKGSPKVKLSGLEHRIRVSL